jgi:hypothetical protein
MKMVDPALVAAGVKTAGPVAKFFGWVGKNWRKWRGYGSLKIDHPPNRQICRGESVEFTGTHDKPSKGHYWVVTSDGDRYWLHRPVVMSPDGRWTGRVNIGKRPGSREVVAHLIWVSDFTHALFEDIKTRSKRGSDVWDNMREKPQDKPDFWGAVQIHNPPKSQFLIVDSRVLQVEIPGP